MIQRYLTENDLGNYSASYKVISFLTFLPIIAANTFYPRILKTINYNDQILKKMYFLSFWISAIVFSFIFFSGSYIINYLYGDNFPMALDVFKISSITLVIIGLNGTYNKVIIKNELNHLLFIKSIFGIFLCITLNFILIPNYGIIGVSYATVLSLFLSDIILDFFIKDLRKHHILKLKSILYFKTIKL
jgi:O-antigen/teichoic acid export membrane protein